MRNKFEFKSKPKIFSIQFFISLNSVIQALSIRSKITHTYLRLKQKFRRVIWNFGAILENNFLLVLVKKYSYFHTFHIEIETFEENCTMLFLVLFSRRICSSLWITKTCIWNKVYLYILQLQVTLFYFTKMFSRFLSISSVYVAK